MNIKRSCAGGARRASNRLMALSGNAALLPDLQGFSIGVGKSLRPPLPPNRASGFPAHGSPVDGFLIGIGTLPHGLRVR